MPVAEVVSAAWRLQRRKGLRALGRCRPLGWGVSEPPVNIYLLKLSPGHCEFVFQMKTQISLSEAGLWAGPL